MQTRARNKSFSWAPGTNSSFTLGDSKKGADLFKQHCSGCHTLEAGGANIGGPNLHGVFGRKSGKGDGVWNEETLVPYPLLLYWWGVRKGRLTNCGWILYSSSISRARRNTFPELRRLSRFRMRRRDKTWLRMFPFPRVSSLVFQVDTVLMLCPCAIATCAKLLNERFNVCFFILFVS